MIKSHEEQLERWLAGELDGKGEAAHVNGQCCPDFACCFAENAASPFDRQQFVDASDDDREPMLVGFLASALKRHYGSDNVTTSLEVAEEALDDEGEDWSWR